MAESRSRVLIADESITVRRAATKALAADGYELREAADGQSALEQAQSFVPDVVLMDMELPVLDGTGLSRALRGISNLRETAIVIMSARDSLLSEDTMRETGAKDAIRKPFGPDALRAVTAHALDRSEHSGVVDLREALGAAEIQAESERREAFERLVGALSAIVASSTGQNRATIEQALSKLDPETLFNQTERLIQLLPGQRGDTSFQGRLEHVSLGDVLQLLQPTDQTGVLRVEAKDGRAIVICIRGGQVDLVLGRGAAQEFLLGRYLLREDLLDEGELDAMLERRGRGREQKGLLGTYLIRLGYITREDLHRVLARQSSELVYEALRWQQGRFSFLRHATRAEAEEAKLALPMTSILMEGLRRVDEWRLIEEQIKSFDLVPHIDPQAVQKTPRERLRADERTVIDTINGERNVREIIDAAKLGSFEVCKILYQLIVSRIVRLDS